MKLPLWSCGWLLALSCAVTLHAVEINGIACVDLQTVAGRLGMKARWLERGERLQLESEWTRLLFERDKREFTLNGNRVHLGFPIAGQRGRLHLSESDFRHTLQPILTPQVFGTPPPVRRIVLDPGHGGGDPGAENPSIGLREKALTLDLARRLKSRLEADGYTVLLTRDSDRFIPLGERARFANEQSADLFLSLHFNASAKTTVSGVETYAYTPHLQPSSARTDLHASDRVAQPGNNHDPWNTLLGYYIQRGMLEGLGAADRGLKRARFTVLQDLRMPGLLVEAGFISHPREGRDIGSAAYRERAAAAIADGLEAYRRTAGRLGPARP
jgi:N-acetylmuramoyl-L-alanine amidase